MICIPITATTIAEAVNQCKQAANEPADLIELRLDFLIEPFDIKTLLAECPLPAIVTYRPTREGGNYTGDEASRIAVLEQAMLAGAAYIDIEADSVDKIKKLGQTKLIASFHNFELTPDDLNDRVAKVAQSQCDIVKFAVMVNNLSDNNIIFNAIQTCTKPIIGMGMGELGEMTRILNLRFGSFLTFGSLASGKESAPGQIPARVLNDLYRVKSITKKTKLFCVIGNPIAHSMSPQLHNTAYTDLAIDAVYLKIRAMDLNKFMNTIAIPMGFEGISVTIPHKLAALEFADTADKLAQQIGVANTLTRKQDGNWHASNTDCLAAIAAIENACKQAGKSLEGCNALVLGAGGTTRAIGFGLRARGVNVTLANRTRQKAEDLAKELGASVCDLAMANSGTYDIVANTTSVGMHPHEGESPISSSVFHHATAAFDVVYNPLRTKFLEDAEEHGGFIADGLQMLVGQAAEQFKIWLSQEPPQEKMRQAALAFLT